MQRYVVIEKQVGETPLQALEAYRASHPELAGVPMTYAGRLDPMASGSLLLLIGEECKRQAQYHNLDKAYTFQVLFGAESDSGDVLGIVRNSDTTPSFTKRQVQTVARSLIGAITLPYPHYSAKTVQGKPLHTWAAEGRISEIAIPMKRSRIYRLECRNLEMLPAAAVYETAQQNIHRLPPVTDVRKALGNDFRRPDVLASWEAWRAAQGDAEVTIGTFYCVASSGTYMRTLASEIATKLGTLGLAWSIHRETMGRYLPVLPAMGVWWRRY